MDFALSPEHLMVQKMVRDYAHKEVYSMIKEADRKQAMHPACCRAWPNSASSASATRARASFIN